MKLRWLAAIILLIGIVAYSLFEFYETPIVEQLAPLFPAHDEHPAGYYHDMIRLVVTELFWIASFLALFLFALSTTRFEKTIAHLDGVVTRNPRVTTASVLIIFALITGFIAVFGLRTFPNSADEYAYLFQAEDLAQGKLWSKVHPLSEFFDFHHIVQKDGKWISRFPPGWPVMLAIAFATGIPPFLINLIVGVIALWFFYKLIRKIYDDRIALWSLIAVAATGYYLFNAASYFSHTSSFLHVVCAMYFTLRYFDRRQWGYALLAGFFVGMLALTRPYTAVLIFAPFYLYILILHRWSSLKSFLLIAAGALPVMIFLFWYNYQTTGNAILPVTVWAYSDEALGFTRDHTPMKGLKHIFKRFMMFLYWASPHLLALYFFFLLGRLRDLRNLWRQPEDFFFVLLVLGYFFYYEYGGNQYGPRFYFEGFPFLIVFVLIKVLRQNAMWGRALFFTGLLYAVVKIPFIIERENEVVEERTDIYEKVSEADLTQAIVFIGSPTGIIRPMDEANLNRNDKDYSNDVLYALDLGQRNGALMQYYPDRKYYRYIRDENNPEGRLIEYKADSLMILGHSPDRRIGAEP